MKNYEKYKTAEEAFNARRRFCKAQESCINCRYSNSSRKIKAPCDYRWFYDEAESDEKPQWQKNIMNKFTSKE